MKAQLLTKHSGILHISFISAMLGAIMNGLFLFMNNTLNVSNIAIVIILFTFAIYIILTPLTYQQQKFAILQSKMNPEIQAIQAKYKGKNDQASAMAMREETKFVYSKYGVTTVGSCLMPFLNILILFNLLFVIYSIPAYIKPVGDVLKPLAQNFLNDENARNMLQTLSEQIKTYAKPNFAKFADMTDIKKLNTIIDALYQLGPDAWDKLHASFPNISLNVAGKIINDGVAHTSSIIGKMTDFLGVNISDTPMNLIKSKVYAAVAFPILAAVTQFANFKLTPQPTQQGPENSVGRSMKTMNYIMPIFSAWFCLSFPVGISIYWIAGPVIRSIQQIFINSYLKKVDVDELVEKNLSIMNEKRAKMGLPPIKDLDSLNNNSKIVNTSYTITEDAKKRAEKARKKTNVDSSIYYKTQPKEGSLAQKARMVEKLVKKDN